jgi:hypothetical protein
MDLFSLWPRRASSSRLVVTACGICHADLTTRLNRHIHQAAEPSFSVPPSLKRHYQWYGNINPFAIVYAFRPRLRTRLTLSRLALPRNPWVFGGQVSHLSSRYSCRHKLMKYLQWFLRSTFDGDFNAPLPLLCRQLFRGQVRIFLGTRNKYMSRKIPHVSPRNNCPHNNP